MLNKEIEKKYIINELPDLSQCNFKEITQGYLSFSPEIRIRKSNDHFSLTKKGEGDLVRSEESTSISTLAYNILYSQVIGNIIEKTRFMYLLNDGLMAEIDIYKGAFDGLKVVEVEFSAEEQAQAFTPPSWFGLEVTTDKRYKNKNLAQAKVEEIKAIIPSGLILKKD